MGFKTNHRKRLAKAFGLSLDEVNELLQRMNGYFRKNGIDNEEIAKSFFILNDILHRKEKQRIKLSIPLFGFKSKGIEKYRVEIVKFDEQGLSPVSYTHLTLPTNHRV